MLTIGFWALNHSSFLSFQVFLFIIKKQKFIKQNYSNFIIKPELSVISNSLLFESILILLFGY
jgi:hypothetical protein